MNCFDGTFSMGKAFALSGGVGKAVRNVSNFNGISQYAVAPRIDEVSLENGFNFEMEWYTDTGTGTPSSYVIHQGTEFGTSELRVYYRYSNTYVVWIMYLGVEFPLTTDPRGAHMWGLVLQEEGATCTLDLYKDGVLVESAKESTANAQEFPRDEMLIGARYRDVGYYNQHFRGQLRDIKIWTGGDRNTGTLTRYYRMDEGWRGTNNQVLVNDATELGEELVVNGTFDTDLSGWDTPNGGWSWSDGKAILNGDGSLQMLQQKLPSEQMLITQNVSVSGGDMYALPNALVTSDTVTLRTGGYIGYKRGNAAIMTGTIDNVSAKQADGYGSYGGLTEASWTEEIA